jgi:hypothetical protein
MGRCGGGRGDDPEHRQDQRTGQSYQLSHFVPFRGSDCHETTPWTFRCSKTTRNFGCVS